MESIFVAMGAIVHIVRSTLSDIVFYLYCPGCACLSSVARGPLDVRRDQLREKASAFPRICPVNFRLRDDRTGRPTIRLHVLVFV